MCMYKFRFMSILACLLECIQMQLSDLECFCIITVSTENCKLVSRNCFLEVIFLIQTELWAFINRLCTAIYLTVAFLKEKQAYIRHGMKSLNSQFVYYKRMHAATELSLSGLVA